jgi:hypothetical protein
MANYAKFRSNTPEVTAVSITISSMVDELAARYANENPSETYCIEKIKIIIDSSNLISTTLGAQ